MESISVIVMACLTGAYLASWLWQAGWGSLSESAREPQRTDTNFWRRAA